MIAWALIAALAAPGGPRTLGPRTLGQALQAVGALTPPGLDHSLDAPPPPPHTGAKILIGSAAALIVGGFAGLLLSGGCATRAADARCLDRQGSDDVYPVMIVGGLALSILGAYWWRQTED